MKGWQVAAGTLTDSFDLLARIQANEYTRGNAVRPVCVKNNKVIDMQAGDEAAPEDVLEYYSLPKGVPHEVKEALYIPLIKPLSDETKINEKLFIPLAYLCASMVFYIFEKPDIAQQLEKTASTVN